MHVLVYNILTTRIRGLKSTAGLIVPDTDSHVAISTDILFVFLFVCLFQMVPILKNSTDTLIEKLGEFAESRRSEDVCR